MQLGHGIRSIGKDFPPRGKSADRSPAKGGSTPSEEAVGVLGNIGEGEMTFSLRSQTTAASKQATEPPIPLPVHRPEQHGAGIGQRDFGSDHELEARFLRRDMGANHARHAVSVGDGQPGVTQHRRLVHQLVGMRRPFQEGEVRLAMKLDITDRRCCPGERIRDRRRGIKLGVLLFRHDASLEEAVQEPTTAAPIAKDPRVRTVLPLGAVIVALDVLRAPPARRDPFRSPGAHHAAILRSPGHTNRRAVGNDRDHRNRLRNAQQSEGTAA